VEVAKILRRNPTLDGGHIADPPHSAPVIAAMQKAAEAGIAATGEDSLARQRLTHMRDFYAVLLDEIPALLDRWHQQPGRPS
jgi:hypothetical protein